MVSFDPSSPASAYSLARSSSDLKVPSSFAALLLYVDRGKHLVAESPDRVVGGFGGVTGGGPVDRLARQLPRIEFPLLPATVEQLDVFVAVKLEVPVRVGGEPVVVAAVEDHGVVVGDTAV
jgi:hypothetical protein